MLVTSTALVPNFSTLSIWFIEGILYHVQYEAVPAGPSIYWQRNSNVLDAYQARA